MDSLCYAFQGRCRTRSRLPRDFTFDVSADIIGKTIEEDMIHVMDTKEMMKEKCNKTGRQREESSTVYFFLGAFPAALVAGEHDIGQPLAMIECYTVPTSFPV